MRHFVYFLSLFLFSWPFLLNRYITTFTQLAGHLANWSGDQAVTLFPTSLTSCLPRKLPNWNVLIPFDSTGGEPRSAIASFQARYPGSSSVTTLCLSNPWRFSVFFCFGLFVFYNPTMSLFSLFRFYQTLLHIRSERLYQNILVILSLILPFCL